MKQSDCVTLLYFLFVQDHGQHEQKDQLSSDMSDQKSSKYCSNGSPPPSSKCVESKAAAFHNVFVKTEPETEEPQLSPAKIGPEETSYSKSDGELKRRLSLPAKTGDISKWSGSQDTRDELKLTAYDVIAGVISTHPIQPLEPDAESTVTSVNSTSPCSTTAIIQSNTTTPTVSHSANTSITPSVSVAVVKNKKDQHSLFQDLDEFSKVMHQVTQEQIAKERRVSSGTEVEVGVYPNPSCPPQLHSHPSYLGMGQSRQETNSNYYESKYIQVPPPHFSVSILSSPNCGEWFSCASVSSSMSPSSTILLYYCCWHVLSIWCQSSNCRVSSS